MNKRVVFVLVATVIAVGAPHAAVAQRAHLQRHPAHRVNFEDFAANAEVIVVGTVVRSAPRRSQLEHRLGHLVAEVRVDESMKVPKGVSLNAVIDVAQLVGRIPRGREGTIDLGHQDLALVEGKRYLLFLTFDSLIEAYRIGAVSYGAFELSGDGAVVPLRRDATSQKLASRLTTEALLAEIRALVAGTSR